MFVEGRALVRALLLALAVALCVGSVCAQQVVSGGGGGAAVAAIPPSTTLNGTSAPYLLRPGDTVTVSYRFTPEFDSTATIAPDGRLALKNLGQVQAAGSSVLELQARLLDVSRRQLVDPEISVLLKDFERPQVVVAGDVRAPQKFELRRPTTVLEAILLAGGPNGDSARKSLTQAWKRSSHAARRVGVFAACAQQDVLC